MTDANLIPLGVLRRGAELVRLVAEETKSGELALRRVALPDLAELRPVAAAWARLAEVATVTEATVRDVLLVAAATAPDSMGDKRILPSLEAEPAPEKPRASAAHPRAFQGTKYKPPKRSSGAATDLRPFMDSKLGFEQLGPWLAAVDPDFQWPAEAWDLPPLLRLAGGASLRELSAAERGRLGALWRGMSGDATGEPGELGARLAVVSFRAGGSAGLTYVDALSRVSPSLRLPVARGLFEAASGARLHPELLGVLGDLDRAAIGIGDPVRWPERDSDGPEPTEEQLGEQREAQRAKRAAYRLKNWAASFALREPEFYPWMLEGVRLTCQFGWEGAEWADPRRPVTSEYGEAVAALAVAAGGYRPGIDVWKFWHAAAHWEGGGQLVLRLADAASLLNADEPEPMPALSTFMRILVYPSDDEATPARRAELGEHIHSWQEGFLSIEPARWCRASALLHDFLFAGDYPLSRALAAMHRLCREPFSNETAWGWVVPELALAGRGAWERFLAAPDESWFTMARFLKRGNEGHLLESGVELLATGHGDWAADLFERSPRAFCELAKNLGLLSAEEGRLLLREAGESGLFGEMPGADAASAVSCLEELALPAGVAQVPKRLRLHLLGEKQLSERQLARDEALMRARWGECVAWSLKARVVERLQRSFLNELPGVDKATLQSDEAWNHALLFQASLESNRRSLRRLLGAVLRGDTDFLSQHPSNRQWLGTFQEATSEAAAEAWARPRDLVRTMADGTEVKLAVEFDPLEALRMGTYVRSCFGLGGGFDYSAAAVVLDQNKHVIYARGADGRFLARQIIGVGTGEEGLALQCNHVYPNVDEAIKDLFREYDERLAVDLGLPLGDDVEIEALISENFFDDGAWGELTEEDEPGSDA